ncbi:MAG: LamG domain-containing protein, partial [Crocosphaera sp.]
MTTTATEKLIRTYSDRQYCHTTMVNHKGTVIAFAMDETRRIYYAVLDISQQDKGFLDVNYWPEDPQLLLFPNEVEQVGYSIAGTTAMPVVKRGSRIEATSEEIQPEEMDLFLSSTARLTANAPFQVISDNKHIFVFRQSIGSEDEDMVFKLANGQASGDNNRPESDYFLNKGQKIPIVENTLLCDRFILSGKELRQKIEIRYRRSRHRTQAAGANDSMGPKDMEGNFFFEPTQELAFVKNMQYGNFSVLQLPTQVSDVKRWQIFSHNSATERIDSFNLEVSGDGLFNPAGTQLYTSPDPEYQSSVLEREPGSCPFTNAPLIPMVNKTNLAESALKFEGSRRQRLNCGTEVGNGSITVEAWIKADNLSGYQTIVGRFNHASKTTNQKGFLFGIADGKVRMAVHNNSLKLHHQADTEKTIIAGEWVHIAGTWEEVTGMMTLYIDGIKEKEDNSSIQAPIIYDHDSPFCINGTADSDGHFTGIIDEVRFWKRVLDDEEIASSQNLRLTGDEPALEGYWRLDEGGGKTVYDQTNNAYHGTLVNSPQWVASDAPLGDHPGIQKSSFLLEGEGSEEASTEAESPQTKTITVTETTQESFTPKCLQFDGNNDYVDCGASLLNNLSAFTFEGWVKNTKRQHSSLFGQNDLLEFGINGEGKLSFWVNAVQRLVTDSAVFPLNEWHHIAIVGTKTKIVLYVDGQPKQSSSFSITNYGTSGDHFKIGAGVWDATRIDPFQGQIGELRVWE